jgi:lambda family phage portal protein
VKQPSLVDRALAFFGLQQKRTASSVFSGASGSRLTLDWVAPILSPDQECRGNLRLLRARARELVRNNPIAKHFLNMLSANVAGPKGMRYQSLVRDKNGEINREVNKQIEAAWEEWSKKGNCTVDGRLSFRAVQDLALRTEAMDGECFVRKVRGFDNRWGFALQLLDADQVDHLFSRPPGNRSGEGNNEVRLGVEVDSWGKPVTYWVNPGHPSDFGGSILRQPIPAEQIVHIFDGYRPNQTRGLTWFHSVMMSLKMLNGYMEAEMVAARTGAAKMGVLECTDATAYDQPDADKPFRMEANPGMLEAIPPGYKLSTWAPDHPSNAFENFVKTNLRWVASGMGASYNALANDLIGVNYSSLRSGLLIERDHWKIVQTHFAEDFMQPVFDEWLKMSLLSGALKLGSRDAALFNKGKWIARGWQWVDPYKETQAAILSVAAALQTRDQIISDRGGDYEEVFEQLAEEKKVAQQFGIELVTELPARPTTQNNPSVAEGEDNSGNNSEETANDDAESKQIPTRPPRGGRGATMLIRLLEAMDDGDADLEEVLPAKTRSNGHR